MLSSDKNVENIAQLIEVLKHYLELEGEYAKLTLIDKVVRLGTAIALAIIFIILALAVFMFFWIGIAFWLSHLIGLTAAFLCVSAAHLVLLLLFFIFRINSLLRFLFPISKAS